MHRGKWLVPMACRTFATGANYEWQPSDAHPSARGRAELEDFLVGLLRLPYEVTGHVAGIRPLTRQGQPVLGAHPEMPGHSLFNGLGSKGALMAPYFARQLLDHLERGTALDEEVDVAKFGSGR